MLLECSSILPSHTRAHVLSHPSSRPGISLYVFPYHTSCFLPGMLNYFVPANSYFKKHFKSVVYVRSLYLEIGRIKIQRNNNATILWESDSFLFFFLFFRRRYTLEPKKKKKKERKKRKNRKKGKKEQKEWNSFRRISIRRNSIATV